MRFSARRRSRAVRAAALAGVLAITLFAAGCAKADPSVAAYVGDSRDHPAAGGRRRRGSVQHLARGSAGVSVGRRQRHDPWGHRGAARCRQQDHDHRRRARRADQEQQPRRPAQRAQGTTVAYDVADQQIVSGKIGSEAYLAAVAKEPVTLNPRFGVLDPNQKTIITDKSASLAKPAATPTP